MFVEINHDTFDGKIKNNSIISLMIHEMQREKSILRQLHSSEISTNLEKRKLIAFTQLLFVVIELQIIKINDNNILKMHTRNDSWNIMF